MDHKPSSIKIFCTKEYGLFRMINGNRELNAGKIKKIKTDIMAGLDVLRYCPLLVVENGKRLDIIDGQHRFWVAKEMKSHVWYIIVENFTLVDIAKINSNTEKWKIKDYINCYISQDNKHYKKLEDFMDTTGFPLSVSQRLLHDGVITSDAGVDANTAEKFRRGKFTVEQEAKANKFVEAVRLFDQFPSWNSRHFLLAIEIILKSGKCDYVDLVDKFKANPGELKKQGSVKEYLSNLEEIYNFRMRIRRVIY